MSKQSIDSIIPIQSDLFGGVVETITKRKQKHQTPSLIDHMFELPDDIYYDIVSKARLLKQEAPELDVFASNDRGDGKTDSKCIYYLTEQYDSLNNDWLIQPSQKIPTSVWINDPHEDHESAIIQAKKQYKKYGFTMVMILPSNTRRTDYWEKHIEPFRFGGDPIYKKIRKHIHNFPWNGSVRFLKKGKPTVNEDPTSPNYGKPQSSRNAYEVLVWMKVKSKFSNHYS